MPRKPTLDQARPFSLFLIKAVLNGRAGEVVDLAKVNFNR
jgi:pyruvate dehydrogenase (quinone)